MVGGSSSGSGSGSGGGSLESRPGVFLIGPPNVGKRTLLSRLLSIDFPDTSDLSSEIICQGWTIETKYYSADISVWTTNLEKGFSFGTLPFSNKLAALVMVFDMSDEPSFFALRDWVSGIDISKFEILLCVGNKADLVPGHYAHVEYRRHMQKHGEFTSDPHPEYLDHGIQESEAYSLLGDEEPSLEIRKSCFEWCSQYNIEFIEACASNAIFDKCLSINGDIQGVDRLLGALSAHMWPGMILKSGNMITVPSLVEMEETTDDESDYEIEYEVLSGGSDEQWDHTGNVDVSFVGSPGKSNREGSADEAQMRSDRGLNYQIVDGTVDRVDTSTSKSTSEGFRAIPRDIALQTGMMEPSNCLKEIVGNQDLKPTEDGPVDKVSTSEDSVDEDHNNVNAANDGDMNEDELVGFDNLERLMCEIGNIRDNLRLMPDFHRRETAAKLATKMAAMFGESSDEGGFE